MRKWCPNFDSESGLDTVLEVPIPEEVFSSKPNTLYALRAWMKPHRNGGRGVAAFGRPTSELQRLLGATGVPLIPLPLKDGGIAYGSIKDHPMEAAMAKYIVEQYIAATGGHAALNSVKTMYAMGKVRITTTSDLVFAVEKASTSGRSDKGSREEVGAFVLWQKNPDLWCIELVVDGCKITAGSDGKVAWRQTPWLPSHASRGPPRHLRRALQGLDPKSTAMLFSNSVCVGEKPFGDEACFVLKFQAEPSALRGQSSKNVEIVRHTVWGYFSQRSGLLVQLQDSHLLRLRAGSESTCWETTMKSCIQDYRLVDGMSIAHHGRTEVSIFRFAETTGMHSTTRMEESWNIEELDFNIWGLSMDCFLPPSDLKKEGEEVALDLARHDRIHELGSRTTSPRDVLAVANDETDSGEEEEEEEEEEEGLLLC